MTVAAPDRLHYSETFASAQAARDAVLQRQADGWRLDAGKFCPKPRRSWVDMTRPAGPAHGPSVRSMIARKADLPLSPPTGPAIGRAAAAVQAAANRPEPQEPEPPTRRSWRMLATDTAAMVWAFALIVAIWAMGGDLEADDDETGEGA